LGPQGDMMIRIQPSGAACGASLYGVDLSQPLDADTVAQIRAAWLAHSVVAFPDQAMSIEDLERFTLAIGPRGDDPFIAPIPGHAHVVEIKREPDEQAPLFAEGWHSDWSFLPSPPAATLLYGNVIPPVGGDTLFANQYAAWETLPKGLRQAVEGRNGIHSARNGYSRQGAYGEKYQGRSMAIRFDDSALATQLHPIGRVHPETGRTALFVSPGYTIGIEGMPEVEARAILLELFAHQSAEAMVYRHRWAEGMLVMWDNRCIVHAATGGYQGYARLLHRITVAERVDA